MRLSLVLSFAILAGSTALTQAQTPSRQALESRYLAACVKEDTEAYCRCEFAALAQRVTDDKDLEFFAELEEQTANQPDAVTNQIIERLSPERRDLVIKMAGELEAVTKQCPDSRQR